MNFKIDGPDKVRDIMARVYEQVAHYAQSGEVEVNVQRPSKTRDQEAKYHAMICDIAASVEPNGEKFGADIWKAWLVDAFDQEMAEQGTPLRHPSKTVISLDQRRPVTIRPSTSKFLKAEASQFIEFLYMKGAELGAVFSERAAKYYEEEMRSRG